MRSRRSPRASRDRDGRAAVHRSSLRRDRAGQGRRAGAGASSFRGRTGLVMTVSLPGANACVRSASTARVPPRCSKLLPSWRTSTAAGLQVVGPPCSGARFSGRCCAAHLVGHSLSPPAGASVSSPARALAVTRPPMPARTRSSSGTCSQPVSDTTSAVPPACSSSAMRPSRIVTVRSVYALVAGSCSR